MRTNDRYTVKTSRIRSLKDIELETERLRLEIMKKEQEIHAGYRNIVDALTFRNLAKTLANDISTTTSVFSKAMSVGKAILSRHKKKKKEKSQQADSPNPS